jgi:hypothetical protein
METTPKQVAVIYNCKRCKAGRRVEYLSIKPGYAYRVTSDGKQVSAGIYVQACGGGRPTVYGGDVEMGLCPTCNRAMEYGTLEARLVPEHKCDARCTSARGHSCECSCGGANHRAGWAA